MYRISAHSLWVAKIFEYQSVSLVDALVKIDLTEQQEKISVIDPAGKEKGLICDIQPGALFELTIIETV